MSISKPITVGKLPAIDPAAARCDFVTILPRNDRAEGALSSLIAADDRSVHSATPTTRFT